MAEGQQRVSAPCWNRTHVTPLTPLTTTCLKPLSYEFVSRDVLSKLATWQWHRTGSSWSPVRTLPVAPLWCDQGFVLNSRGNKAAANLSLCIYLSNEKIYCSLHLATLNQYFAIVILGLLKLNIKARRSVSNSGPQTFYQYMLLPWT